MLHFSDYNMSEVVKKKVSTEKLTELEFEIRILEQNESCLPKGEIVRLNNLRRKHELQKTLGWSCNETVPVKLLDRFKVPKSKNTISNSPNSERVGDVQNVLDKSSLKRKKGANGYNYYVEEMKQKQVEENSKEVLNMTNVRSYWKKLSPSEKIKYKEMAQEDLNNGEDTTENISKTAKEMKKERDKNYNRKKGDIQKQEKDEKDAFIIDFENILEAKKRKLENLNNLKEELKNEIALAASDNEIVTKMVEDQDKEEQSLKFKIKDIFCHHKSCKK